MKQNVRKTNVERRVPTYLTLMLRFRHHNSIMCSIPFASHRRNENAVLRVNLQVRPTSSRPLELCLHCLSFVALRPNPADLKLGIENDELFNWTGFVYEHFSRVRHGRVNAEMANENKDWNTLAKPMELK
ncbi:hypothetical protein OUZ56_030388 [Daphnia magna]|uniref:Uncharacterized protein n=1 Tax=Daphnia magna TaxID=35525 RepID=A0ABQ9ZR52_9CRUS|nr:hypothetical protein OUZ56_030388 [Daphnia magna]